MFPPRNLSVFYRGYVSVRPCRVALLGDAFSFALWFLRAPTLGLLIRIWSNWSLSVYVFLSLVYTEDDFRGNAVTLTGDGWLVAPSSAFDTRRELILLGNTGKEFEITNTVNDSYSGLTYFQVDGNGFNPVDFYRGAIATESNATLYNYAGSLSSNRFMVKSPVVKEKSILVSFTEKMPIIIEFVEDAEPEFDGSVVVNDHNQITGIYLIDNGAMVKPDSVIHGLELAIEAEKDEVIRPTLGVSYIDVSRINDIANVKSGALIYRNTRLGARGVTLRSPAAKADLNIGDIIVAVNDQNVDEDNDLSELIQKYKPGEIVSLTVLKGDVAEDIEVELE